MRILTCNAKVCVRQFFGAELVDAHNEVLAPLAAWQHPQLLHCRVHVPCHGLKCMQGGFQVLGAQASWVAIIFHTCHTSSGG